MSEAYEHIADLVVKYLKGDLLVDEKMELEKWAELDQENRIFLENIDKAVWLEDQIRIFNDCDLAEANKKIWEKIRQKKS